MTHTEQKIDELKRAILFLESVDTFPHAITRLKVDLQRMKNREKGNKVKGHEVR